LIFSSGEGKVFASKCPPPRKDHQRPDTTSGRIHAAAVDFRLGAKAKYIDIVDVVVGMKAPRRGQPGFEGD
jgi:hypothetical protein